MAVTSLASPAIEEATSWLEVFVLRGMLVGVVAGLLAFGVAKVFGEPQVDRAIAFEVQFSEAKGEAPESASFSRPTQTGISWTTLGLLFGALTERRLAERLGGRLSAGPGMRYVGRPIV